MAFKLTTIETLAKSFSLFPILTVFFLILSHVTIAAVDNRTTTSIGAIVDDNTPIGKEVKTAMEIAVEKFNNHSMSHKLSLHFQNPQGNPLQAVYVAEKLVKENKVEVIIGMQTWPEIALVADIGNRFQVPIISLFSEVARTPQFLPVQWPFLVEMARNVNEQIKGIASIIHSFHWRKVIAIYEADNLGGDLGMLGLLSEELQKIGSEIEYRLVLPQFSSLSNPERIVRQETVKLLHQQARVYIILRISLPMATYLFKEAKQMGLVGRDSAWLTTESTPSLLEGSIGLKTHFSDDTKTFLNFKRDFRQSFRQKYPQEDDLGPDVDALRAYDSIFLLTKATEGLNSIAGSISSMLIKNILSASFTGLSGLVRFRDGELSSIPTFRIINVVGRTSYKELGFWSSKSGFSETLVAYQEGGEENRTIVNGSDTMEVLASMVDWPGKVKRVPKGWAMPSDEEPMKIGVPGRTSFEKFVKVEGSGGSNLNYSGFCIEVFNKVIGLLDYSFPYKFHPYNGTYDDLVDHVTNKTFHAVIGDVTILANRARNVEFTQPFSESSLTVIAPVKSQAAKAWIFLKPFTLGMWVCTGAILIYTMSIVWLLERQNSPDFEGPWKHQLSTALWFTFSSLFFAHREKVYSNYTRVVVVVWLFVVLALNSSYTASLSSMLTVSKLEPDVTDIAWLKRENKPVGCDSDSFTRKYLEDVIQFKSENIKNISSEYDYPEKLNNGSITVAFLELPYEKAFLNQYCKGYTGTTLNDRFGGLGFVFQKGSPIAADFSEAILKLSEDGTLKQLESKWFDPSNCLISQTPETQSDKGSLSIQSFWGLYLFSGTISTICILLFYIRQLRQREMSPNNDNVWHKIVKIAQRFRNRGTKSPEIALVVARVCPVDEDNTSSKP